MLQTKRRASQEVDFSLLLLRITGLKPSELSMEKKWYIVLLAHTWNTIIWVC